MTAENYARRSAGVIVRIPQVHGRLLSPAGGGLMPLVTLVVYLVIVGVLLWLVNNYVPMDGRIKQIINVVVVLVVVVWLLRVFGVMGPLSHIKVG
jgi:hypothetical protein